MGFFKGVAKLLLFLVNFAILVCAIVLITIGAIYKSNNAGLDIMSVSTYAIAIGVIIALISFFGCYGACSTNGCLLTTYAVILITLLIAQLVLGILAFIAIKNGDGELNTEVIKYLTKLFNNYWTNTDQREIVDSLQKNFECCGIQGTIDAVTNTTAGSGVLVSSCCESWVGNCNAEQAYEKGCAGKLTEFFEDHAKIIGGVALGFCVFELVAAIFACCVRKKRDGRYV